MNHHNVHFELFSFSSVSRQSIWHVITQMKGRAIMEGH